MSIRTLFRSSRIPGDVKRAFKHALILTSQEQLLWREAAVRHVLDAFGVVEQGEQEHVDEAREWFRSAYDDVHLLFEYAGVDLYPVLKALEPILCQNPKSSPTS